MKNDRTVESSFEQVAPRDQLRVSLGKETRGDLELDGAEGEDPPSAEVEVATAYQSD